MFLECHLFQRRLRELVIPDYDNAKAFCVRLVVGGIKTDGTEPSVGSAAIDKDYGPRVDFSSFESNFVENIDDINNSALRAIPKTETRPNLGL